jgi:hypothetical protein
LCRLNSIAIFMFCCTISILIPSVVAAESVSKPTVTLPSTGGWYLSEDIPYPDAADTGVYDSAGLGLLKYWATQTDSSVFIWYESALGSTWTAAQLEDESYDIHDWYWGEDYPVWADGQWTVAGTSAGYTKGWDEAASTDSLAVVLVKNDVYVFITALYEWDAEDEVMSIINSLEVPAAGFAVDGLIIYLVIGLVAAAAVIVAVVFWRRKKPKEEPKRTTVKFEPVMSYTV